VSYNLELFFGILAHRVCAETSDLHPIKEHCYADKLIISVLRHYLLAVSSNVKCCEKCMAQPRII